MISFPRFRQEMEHQTSGRWRVGEIPRKLTCLRGKSTILKMYFLLKRGFSNVILVFRGVFYCLKNASPCLSTAKRALIGLIARAKDDRLPRLLPTEVSWGNQWDLINLRKCINIQRPLTETWKNVLFCKLVCCSNQYLWKVYI